MAEQLSVLEQAVYSQNRASCPKSSAWVSASAGSGKTKVLTDRLLRILLAGTDPQKIMCLTFTKAAAAEMQNRLNEKLSDWVSMKDVDLEIALERLQVTPSSGMLDSARSLFYKVLESPGGIKIQTIHGFCQSILKRFPLEAGVSPHFEVADELTSEVLLKKAWHRLYENQKTRQVLKAIAENFGELQFAELNKCIISDHAKVAGIREDFQRQLMMVLGIDDGWNFAKAIDLLSKPVTEVGAWGQWPQSESEFHEYKKLFLTKSGEIRKRLLNNDESKKNPDLLEWVEKTAEIILRIDQQLKLKEIYELSTTLMSYMRLLTREYGEVKREENLLDYNDLIHKTANLLSRANSSQWVLYKLDGGIEHILVDEAQDTNSTQWQVIKAIGDEFFNSQDDRTLFVVGDEKQSIYSFQGADPAIFSQVKESFKHASISVEKKFEEIGLRVSFRSSNAVLNAVDQTFQADDVRRGVANTTINHLAFRESAPGRVELWPLIVDTPQSEIEPWALPALSENTISARTRLAQEMATTIKNWLRDEKLVQSRKMTPGDILVLVRKRSDFVFELANALKEHGIPVAGADRMVLLEQLVVQDLLALMQFALCPDDDLTLATILKGPLFNWDDGQLFSIAHDRGDDTLWDRLIELKPRCLEVSLLRELISIAGDSSPHRFLNKILIEFDGYKRFRARLGDQILDAVQELLGLSLKFAKDNPPSLQLFLYWIEGGSSELKRDLDQADEVRIMTVHGSKGLQSPIVFMPDTTQIPSDIPDFVWHKNLALSLPSDSGDVAFTKLLKAEHKARQLEEYNRLLYVAMTRAEDELYVAGWSKSQKINDKCWYQSVKLGLASIAEQTTFKGDFWHGDGLVLIDGDNIETTYNAQPKNISQISLPECLHKALRPEPIPSMPLSPSRITADSHTSFKGIVGGMHRGRIIHKLLEILPGIKPELWEMSCEHYLEYQDFSEEERAKIQTMVIEIMARNSEIFGENSLSEVPIVGSVGSINISGKIDRLVVQDSQVLILDYKTNFQVPQTISEISEAYILQLALYRELLCKIYPNYQIVCQLLWTEELKLDTIEESVMIDALDRFMDQRRAA